MFSPVWFKREMTKLGLTAGSKDLDEFQVGMEWINKQGKLFANTRNSMIKALKEFLEV